MALDTAFQKRMQRIGEMVELLETTADPSARAVAKELLQSFMELHGAGLDRILELVAESGDTGQGIIQKCGQDDLVGSLLLLYGLHPEDLRARVTRVLDKSRGYLESHSASAELVSIREDGVVTIRLSLKASGCGSSAAALQSTLEATIKDAAPDALSIVVEQSGAQNGFVTVAQLQSGQAMPSLSAARMQRSGD